MKKIFKFLVIIFFNTLILYSQRSLNLDFEIQRSAQPVGWYRGGEGYSAILDSNITHSGKRSVRLKQLEQLQNNFGVITGTFPVGIAKGKIIKFSGWIKTEKVGSGYAGLWFRVDSKYMTSLAFDNMHDRGVTGTKDWGKYEIELYCDTAATNINYGALLTGDGAAWFDKFEITLDGIPYIDENLMEEPKMEELEQIKKGSIILNTCEPGGDYSDLMPLKEVFRNADIVGLGEATHGTSEIFKMKHRIVEFLANEMGYTIFSIEANMPESYAVNDYILYGKGDVKELLQGMYFWTWQTQEVADMVNWMKDFNESGKGKVLFTGFDMQIPEVAMDIVGKFIEANDPEYSESYNKTIQELKKFKGHDSFNRSKEDKKYVDSLTSEIINRLTERKTEYLKTIPADTVDWIIQNAHVIRQATSPANERDKHMADNVEWIYKNAPKGTKIVLWAHNYHISRENGAMGSYLNEKFGDRYLPVGFAIGTGEYTAVGADKNSKNWVHKLVAPEPGSLEYFFGKAGNKICYFDIKNSDSDFLNNEYYFRSLGALEESEQFHETPVKKYFDGIIYIEDTKHTDMFWIKK